MLNSLAAASAWLARALMFVAVLATVAMALHILADISSRFFLNWPIPGTLEIATHYYLIPMTFLPLAAVELRREHIVVEAFTHFLPERWIEILDIIVRITCIACLVIFAWRTGLEAIDSTIKNEDYEAIFFDVLIWPTRWVLPLSFLVFALAMLSTTLKPFKTVSEPQPDIEV